MKTYALLAEQYDPPRVESFAALLGEALGLLPYEALRAARSARGILAEGLDWESASRIGEGLARDGFSCRVLPQEEIPPLYRPRTAREIQFQEEGLLVRRGYGDSWDLFPWGGLLLLSAGVIPEEEGGGMGCAGREGGGIGLGGVLRLAVDPVGGALSILKKSKPRGGEGKKRKALTFLQPLADLCFRGEEEGAFQWIRLRGREVARSFLPGGQGRAGFYEAFLAFLERTAGKAGPERLSLPVGILLSEGPEHLPERGAAFFPGEREFRLFNRWTLTCLHSGRP